MVSNLFLLIMYNLQTLYDVVHKINKHKMYVNGDAQPWTIIMTFCVDKFYNHYLEVTFTYCETKCPENIVWFVVYSSRKLPSVESVGCLEIL